MKIINIDPETGGTCHRCGYRMRYHIWWDSEYCPKCDGFGLEEWVA